MDTHTLLWIGQIFLALAFAVAGAGHAFGYERMITQPRMSWMSAVGPQNMRIIGYSRSSARSDSSCPPPPASCPG